MPKPPARWRDWMPAASQVLTTTAFVYLARSLEPSQFGDMRVLAVWVGVLRILWLAAPAAQAARPYADERGHGVPNMRRAALACAALVYLAAPQAAHALNTPALTPHLRWASLLPLAAMLPPRPRSGPSMAHAQLISSGVLLTGILVLVSAGWHLGALSASLLLSAAAWAVAYRIGPTSPPPRRAPETSAKFAETAMDMLSHLLIVMTPFLWLKSSVSSFEAGVFAGALVGARIPEHLIGAGGPWLNRLVRRTVDRNRDLTALPATAALLAAALGAWAASPFLLSILLGGRYAADPDKVRLLFLGAVFHGVGRLSLQTARGLGNARGFGRLPVAVWLLELVLLAVLVPASGAHGAALAYAACSSILAVSAVLVLATPSAVAAMNPENRPAR